MGPTRRVFLKQAGRLSMLVVTYPIWQPLIASADIEATPDNGAGPYYVSGAPVKTNLREPGDHGQPVSVSGKVIHTNGKPLSNSQIEIWHSNNQGNYDMNGFRYRANVPISPNGDYQFKTFMPGHYGNRAQHIHYRISERGNTDLFTQLYFENDPLFESNPQKNYTKDPILQYPQLIRPVQMKNSELFVYFAIAVDSV